MPLLKLPPTVRTARPDEVPKYDDLLDRIKESQHAKIIEGYTIMPSNADTNLFQFYAEINVDNDRLWTLFQTLLLTFSDEVSFIFGHIDQEMQHSEYLDKFSLLNKIETFQTELTQDPYLEFGVIFQDTNSLREVFVSKNKYLMYWGMNDDPFGQVMENFFIHQVDDLKFIDEFPVVRENLNLFDPTATATRDIIGAFHSMFDV